MAALATSAVTVVTAAAFLPTGLLLSAAQFGTSDTFLGNPAAQSSQSSGIEIVPRGGDSAAASVPFRPSARAISRPVPVTAARPITASRARATQQRAVLQTPIFSAPQSINESARTAVSRTASGSQAAAPKTSANVGHSGLCAPRSTQRRVGNNFVEASGIANLPHASNSPTTSSSRNATAVTGAGRTRPTTWQDGEFPDLSIPAAQSDAQSPRSPVPAVPVQTADGLVPSNPGSSERSVSPAPLNHEELSTPSSSPEPVTQGPGVASSPPAHPSQRSVQAPALNMSDVRPGTSGFRANMEADGSQWITPYLGRTGMLPGGIEESPTPAPSVIMPENFAAWWDGMVQQRAGIAPRTLAVDVTSLVQQALVHSPKVQVLQADPEVQQRVVKQEEAVFDWRAFLDSKYDDLNDPIGNTLTTGNNDNRFTDHHSVSSGGLKRRTSTGGEVRLSQQFGYQDNNSRFLLPNAQSTSRMELSFRQPVLSRSGTVYNQNQIVLARISASSAGDETLAELQNHLYSVTESYWKLYRARAEFLQRQKLLAAAQNVMKTLEGRNQVDTIPRQILRARAAVARAESRMQRAVTDIRNAESQLRLLVNDPEMLEGGPVEFTPTEMPCMTESPVGLRDSLETALVNRPDISFAIRQMRASSVRMGVSKSELLPKLDFIVSSYVAGLENKAQFVDSFNNQFTQGRPGYTVGMEFEVPLGNRAAKAKMEQRQWELKRAINSFRTTVETSLTEVEIASREVDTSWRELLGRYQAMLAAQNEVSYLQDRFDVLPMVEESSMLLLEDLLDGNERLADEEAAFSQAQTNYALSIIQLRRATGTMLRSRHDVPELDNQDSEWMQTRVEQAALDGHIKTGRTASTASTAQNTPARPVVRAPGGLLAKSTAPETLVAAPISRTKPVSIPNILETSNPPAPKTKIGGHSFRNGF